jgi:NAD(P)-dependent dehydrogenase (short-subunit alcohol dehydrogenase family)
MKRLAGKVAVITGAGRPGGLGAAIARRLAEDGARIVISDIGQVVDEATPLEMIGAAEDIERNLRRAAQKFLPMHATSGRPNRSTHWPNMRLLDLEQSTSGLTTLASAIS